MDNYMDDPVGCIRRNVIMIRNPGLGAMPKTRDAVTDKTGAFTDAGSTIFVKCFDYNVDMESDDEPPTTTEGQAGFGEAFMDGADGDSGDDTSEESRRAEYERLTSFVGEPTRFRWTAVPNVTIVGTEATGTYDLSVGGTGSGLRAYLLPWVGDGITWMHLDLRFRFFFTDAMNGCTLFIGGSAQAPVVAHSNVGDTTARAERTPPQFQVVRDRLGTELKWTVFDKTGYISDSERTGRREDDYPVPVGTLANVIGFVRNGGWEFWAQAYMLYGVEGGGRSLVRDIEVAKLFPSDS
jgi:hypothetical protein